MAEGRDWYVGNLAGDMCAWLSRIASLEQKLLFDEARQNNSQSLTPKEWPEFEEFMRSYPDLLSMKILGRFLDLYSLRSFGCVSKAAYRLAKPLLDEWDQPLIGRLSLIAFVM